MQLTLCREIAKIAAGMVWHDQHMPLMRDCNKRAFQQSLFLGIHLRSLYLGCNALHTLLYLFNYHVNTIINNEIYFEGSWKFNSIELHNMKNGVYLIVKEISRVKSPFS